jgi:hypothetical protein
MYYFTFTISGCGKSSTQPSDKAEEPAAVTLPDTLTIDGLLDKVNVLIGCVRMPRRLSEERMRGYSQYLSLQ